MVRLRCCFRLKFATRGLAVLTSRNPQSPRAAESSWEDVIFAKINATSVAPETLCVYLNCWLLAGVVHEMEHYRRSRDRQSKKADRVAPALFCLFLLTASIDKRVPLL